MRGSNRVGRVGQTVGALSRSGMAMREESGVRRFS